MEKELIEKSLDTQYSFSSSQHSSEVFAQEGVGGKNDYNIPSRYFSNTLKLLPVNINKYYLYWELLEFDAHEYYVRVIDSDSSIHFEIKIEYDVSEYYINQSFENIDLMAQIGFYQDGEFHILINSNTIRSFSKLIKYPKIEDEVWMSKIKQMHQIVTKTSVHFEDTPNSRTLIKDFEAIKKLHEISLDVTNISSSSNVIGVSND